MSAHRGDFKAYFEKEGRTSLDEVVNFGPEGGDDTEFSSRVRDLMKKLQELDARIERLDEQL